MLEQVVLVDVKQLGFDALLGIGQEQVVPIIQLSLLYLRNKKGALWPLRIDFVDLTKLVVIH